MLSNQLDNKFFLLRALCKLTLIYFSFQEICRASPEQTSNISLNETDNHSQGTAFSSVDESFSKDVDNRRTEEVEKISLSESPDIISPNPLVELPAQGIPAKSISSSSEKKIQQIPMNEDVFAAAISGQYDENASKKCENILQKLKEKIDTCQDYECTLNLINTDYILMIQEVYNIVQTHPVDFRMLQLMIESTENIFDLMDTSYSEGKVDFEVLRDLWKYAYGPFGLFENRFVPWSDEYIEYDQWVKIFNHLEYYKKDENSTSFAEYFTNTFTRIKEILPKLPGDQNTIKRYLGQAFETIARLAKQTYGADVDPILIQLLENFAGELREESSHSTISQDNPPSERSATIEGG